MADSRLRGYRERHPCTGNSTYKDAEAGSRQALDIPEREEKSGGGDWEKGKRSTCSGWSTRAGAGNLV